MSNTRRLRPHELARRDQAFAHATDLASHGTPVMVLQYAPVGQRCCWCDCPDVPDSPHMTPGYVCGNLCEADAEYVLQAGRLNKRMAYMLCERHQFGPLEQLIALGVVDRDAIEFGEPWMDPA